MPILTFITGGGGAVMLTCMVGALTCIVAVGMFILTFITGKPMLALMFSTFPT